MAFIIDPTSASFPAVLSDLEAFQASRPDAAVWNTFFVSGTGQTVTETVAALGTFLTYRTIAGRRENYLQYAQNISSIIGISESLGYSVFRGQNAHLSLVVVPSATQVLPRFSIVGAIKDQDIIVLADTPLVANVPITITVAMGKLSNEAITAPSSSPFVFRFESPSVTEDLRVLLNGTEVSISSQIIDLKNGDFVVLTNALQSVDVSSLNDTSYALNYNSGDVVSIEFLAQTNISFLQTDINFFYGSLTSYSVASAYQAFETNDSAKINAPLYPETQALVRARLDFLKVFKITNPTFVSTNQTNLSTSRVQLVYLQQDFSALTAAQKSAAVASIVATNLPMGIPPPTITDPVRVPITLVFNVSLLNNQQNTSSLIQAITAAKENILGGPLSLSEVEYEVDQLTSVLVNRVTIGSTTWSGPTSYETGSNVNPTSANGFIYELDRIIYFSGATQPAWPTTLGAAVQDGGVVWTSQLIDPTNLTTSTWSADTDYVLGATVVPTVPNGRQYQVTDYVNSSFGVDAVQSITFDAVPASGTWRISQTTSTATARTVDLPYNADAAAVQAAINQLSCLNGDTVVTGNYSTGFTVTFEGLDGNHAQPLLSVSDPGTDEVQLVSFSSVPDSGSFGLTFSGQTTAPIPYTASAADVQAALEALSNVDSAPTSGDFTNGFTVTFQGENSRQPVPQMAAALPATAGTDAVQTISFSSVPTAGTWRLHNSSGHTADMAFDANTTTIQTQVNTLPGLSGLTVTGSYAAGFTVGFHGASGLQPQPLLISNNPGQNCKQLVQFSQVPDFGTWALSYNGNATSAIQFNASTSDIQAALNAVSGLTGAVVTGDYATGITVEFASANGLQAQPLLVLSSSTLVKADNPITVTISQSQEGLKPADSVTASSTPVTVSVATTAAGQVPVSDLARSSVAVDVVITTPTEGAYPASNLRNSGNGPVAITVTEVVEASSAEPVWPTVLGSTIYDGGILWLAVKYNGTPATWLAGTDYHVGDYAAPSTTVNDTTTSTTPQQLMFQCIGYLGVSSGTQPTWPTTLNQTVVDGTILWKARLPNADPDPLAYNEYYQITDSITLTGPPT